MPAAGCWILAARERAAYIADVLPASRHLVLVCFGLACFPAAVQAVPFAPDWFKRVWQADDGLPGDNVAGIAQSREGFLWIATQSGLAHFDGVSIRPVTVPVGRGRPIIRAMLLDRSGQFWLAQERGVLAAFADGRATLFTATNGLSRAQPLELTESGDGAVWIAYADGAVCRIHKGQVTRFGETAGLEGSGPCSLAADAQGRLWFARGGQVGRFQDGRFAALFSVNERNVRIRGARDSGLWIGAGNRLLHCSADASPRELGRIPADNAPVRPTALLEDETGAVWIGTAADGLFRFDGTNFTAIETSHGRIQCLLQDREGNIWVGTDGGGLNRLRPQAIELHGRDAGLPFDTVRSVCEDAAGALWVVTQDGAVSRRQTDRWSLVSSGTKWPGGQATTVTGDSQGNVWVGTYSRGLYQWRDNEWSFVRRSNGLASSSIRSLLADRRGNLWIAFSTLNVLQRFRDGHFQNYPLPPRSRAIRAMAEDAAGNLWLANLDARLLRVRGDAVVDETPGLDGQYRPIRCLAGTPDGSLWIGFSTIGLGRLKDGQFARIGREQGLHDAGICSLVPDETGWVWCGSDHGLFRVGARELTDAAEGRATTVTSVSFGRDDGLPSLQGYYGYAPGAARARDGRILVPTHSGLAIIHPGRVRENRIPPHPFIEEVRVDGVALPPKPASETRVLPPNHHKLDIIFTAPSFIEPEKVRFEYQLQGWDEVAVEAGPERHAVYSRLPAGRYAFHLRARNNAGLWNETPAVVRFQVTPFFWQTWWFRAAVVALFAALVYGITRHVSVRRLRAKVRRLEQENALQQERARIAHDIHDDLGAHMTQISLLSELARRALPEPRKAGDLIQQIADMSRRGIKSLDEIVWAVNPRNDTVQDLLDYAGQYAVDFLRAAGIRCRVDFPESPPARALPADMRHSLFLAVKEALHNVVKHAQATEVWLRVRVTDTALQWAIEDNGRGIGPTAETALADGRRNMRERLAALGGHCSWEARPAGGTRILLDLPWRPG